MDRGNEKNRPFFFSFLMNDFILHNCMLDLGASSNVMTKKVMEQLNLRISRPYNNIFVMDSKTIKVHGLIKGLQVHLAAFPDIMIEVDIVVIDVPDAWGMLLSRKTSANLGGNLKMDLTYATIPTPNGSMFRLNRESERKYMLTIKIKTMNSTRKGLLKRYYLIIIIIIIQVGGTPLWTRDTRIDISHIFCCFYDVAYTVLHFL
jgi:hypothetical protein